MAIEEKKKKEQQQKLTKRGTQMAVWTVLFTVILFLLTSTTLTNTIFIQHILKEKTYIYLVFTLTIVTAPTGKNLAGNDQLKICQYSECSNFFLRLFNFVCSNFWLAKIELSLNFFIIKTIIKFLNFMHAFT